MKQDKTISFVVLILVVSLVIFLIAMPLVNSTNNQNRTSNLEVPAKEVEKDETDGVLGQLATITLYGDGFASISLVNVADPNGARVRTAGPCTLNWSLLSRMRYNHLREGFDLAGSHLIGLYYVSREIKKTNFPWHNYSVDIKNYPDGVTSITVSDPNTGSSIQTAGVRDSEGLLHRVVWENCPEENSLTAVGEEDLVAIYEMGMSEHKYYNSNTQMVFTFPVVSW